MKAFHSQALMSRTEHFVSPFSRPSPFSLAGQHLNCRMSDLSTFLRSTWELVNHAHSWVTPPVGERQESFLRDCFAPSTLKVPELGIDVQAANSLGQGQEAVKYGHGFSQGQQPMVGVLVNVSTVSSLKESLHL